VDYEVCRALPAMKQGYLLGEPGMAIISSNNTWEKSRTTDMTTIWNTQLDY